MSEGTRQSLGWRRSLKIMEEGREKFSCIHPRPPAQLRLGKASWSQTPCRGHLHSRREYQNPWNSEIPTRGRGSLSLRATASLEMISVLILGNPFTWQDKTIKSFCRCPEERTSTEQPLKRSQGDTAFCQEPTGIIKPTGSPVLLIPCLADEWQIKITCSLRSPVTELLLFIVFHQGFASVLTSLAALWRAHTQNSWSCLLPKIHCSLWAAPLSRILATPGRYTRQTLSGVLCSQGNKKAPPDRVKCETPRKSNFPSLGIVLSSWGDNFWTALHKFQKTSSWAAGVPMGPEQITGWGKLCHSASYLWAEQDKPEWNDFISAAKWDILSSIFGFSRQGLEDSMFELWRRAKIKNLYSLAFGNLMENFCSREFFLDWLFSLCCHRANKNQSFTFMCLFISPT